MSGGTAGIELVDYMVSLLRENLGGNIKVSKIWEEKEVGHGDSDYEVVFVGHIREDPSIFSLQHEGDDGNAAWDWMHKVHLYLDVRTGTSERRAFELVNECMSILKRNVLAPGARLRVLQMIPGGTTNMNEDFRNMYRYQQNLEMLVFNP